jgi:hypothetical protein
MKKIAIGCGVIALILLIGAAVATYFVVNKVQSAVAEFAALGEVPEIERGVRNKEVFSPPTSAELTEAQVARFVQVQQQVRSLVGTRFAEFETKYKDLSERMNKDLAQTFVAAKRAQVDALNDAGMSLDEYRWIRTQAYAALGIPLGEFDVSQVIDDIREGRQPRQPEGVVVAPTGPEVNRTLVEPHRKTLEENAALPFFGL